MCACDRRFSVHCASVRSSTCVRRALRKWVDTAEDGKHALLHARCEARVGRLAAALRALDKATTAAMEVPSSMITGNYARWAGLLL